MENDDDLLTLCGWEQDDEDKRQISCSWVKATAATKPSLLQPGAWNSNKASTSAALREIQPQQARYKPRSESDLTDDVKYSALVRHRQPRRRRMSMTSAVIRPMLFPHSIAIEQHKSLVKLSPQAAAPESPVQTINARVDADASLTRCQTLPALPGCYLTRGLSRPSWKIEKPSQDQLPPCDSIESPSNPPPELKPRKRDLIRRQSGSSVIPVPTQYIKPKRIRTVRTVKLRMRVRVSDLLLDSPSDDLSHGLKQLSLDPEPNQSLWDCEDEETCCSIYENSLGLVKVLTQFNERQEANTRRARTKRTRW